MLVEIWSIGSIESNSYVLLSGGWVINGEYQLITDKENSTVYIPFTKETHESHYLGDVEFNGDYNEVIDKYRDTKQIVGRNLVKKKKESPKPSLCDEPPF